MSKEATNMSYFLKKTTPSKKVFTYRFTRVIPSPVRAEETRALRLLATSATLSNRALKILSHTHKLKLTN